MISQTAEYALRATVFLAMSPEQAFTTQQISAQTRVPAAYLSKVLQALARAGLVQSQRGIGGGFTLTRQPGEITVLDVVNAVDPIKRIESCPLGIESHGTNLCAMHKKLDDAMASVESAFGCATIAFILANPTDSIPLHGDKPLCVQDS